MNRNKALLPASLVLISALALAGCGSDDKPSSSSTPTTTPTSSATSTASSDPGSALVTIDAEGFSVGLPHKATSSEESFPTSAGAVKATVYSDIDDNGGFIVAMAPYPNGATVDLDGAVKGVADNFGGTLGVNETISIEGHDARQVRIDGGSSGGQAITIYLLAADVDNKLFQMQYVIKGTAPAESPAILGQVAASLTFS